MVGKFGMGWEESWDYLTPVPNLFCWEYLVLFMYKVGKILFFPTKISTFTPFSQPFRTHSSVIPTFFPQHDFLVLGFSTGWILLLGILHRPRFVTWSSRTSPVFLTCFPYQSLVLPYVSECPIKLCQYFLIYGSLANNSYRRQTNNPKQMLAIFN